LPAFEYQAKDQSGNTVRGTLDAASQQIAARELRLQGYFPMRVQPRATGTTRGREKIGLALFPVKLRDRALFFRHLSATLKAGITPARALHTCVDRTPDTRLRRMARNWVPQIEAGTALSEVMRQYPEICPPVTAEIVRAGEAGGFLDSAFSMIAEDLEMQIEVQQQMKWQTLYFKALVPLILLVPPLPGIISLEREPVSHYITRYLSGLTSTTLPIIVVLAVLWLFLRVSRAIPRLADFVDSAKMLVPGYSSFAHNSARARFFTNFAYLANAGVPIAGSLRTAASTCGIHRMQRAMMEAVPALEKGSGLTETLQRTGQLGRHDAQILATGEESGTMTDALEKIAHRYQSEVKATMKNLGNVLRIPLYVAAGAAVAYAVGSAATAYFDRVFELGDEMMNF